jgi:hypothetical protein
VVSLTSAKHREYCEWWCPHENSPVDLPVVSKHSARMNAESTTPDATALAAVAALVFPLQENGKSTGQWSLTIHPSHLSLADAPGAQPYVILREQFKKEVSFMEGMRALVVKQPRKIIFKLTPEAADALANWLGKPFLAAFYLKRRFSWLFPWALIWAVGSLIVLIPTPEGRPPIPFDVASFLLGVALMVSCAFAKWRPHPILFLVDSLWFASVTVNLSVDVVYGRSAGWLVLVALTLWMSVTGMKHFFRFRGVKITPFSK